MAAGISEGLTPAVTAATGLKRRGVAADRFLFRELHAVLDQHRIRDESITFEVARLDEFPCRIRSVGRIAEHGDEGDDVAHRDHVHDPAKLCAYAILLHHDHRGHGGDDEQTEREKDLVCLLQFFASAFEVRDDILEVYGVHGILRNHDNTLPAACHPVFSPERRSGRLRARLTVFYAPLSESGQL